MKQAQLDFSSDFAVIFGNQRAQAAVMVLQPDEVTGGPDNRHRGSDQWLYVIAGEGSAVIDRQTCALRPGVLVLIEEGEPHEIRNEGKDPLQTLNFYAPPAFSPDGEMLSRGQA
jgi:mannose-6-phosphate isomerase-like protein (cupin superfamily)